MSIAGIRSNRGDGYQTLVAFDWALTVLSDPDFAWIEIDSAMHSVDDVVIGKSDGTQICCQCKKNQQDLKAWSIADLADELEKASRLLANKTNTEIRFYSRSPFGLLAKLREHCTTQANEANYLASLGKEHLEINTALAVILNAQSLSLSTYEFLRRTSFEISPELDRMAALLSERLRSMASNPSAAFSALWTRLDQLGARMSDSNTLAAAQHRLTKGDLKAILHHAGALLVPSMNLAEVRTAFSSTSAIGRAWHRNIAGEFIPSPIVNELLAAIDDNKRAILLTGLPGSGKTCAMLSLQEALEQRAQSSADMVSLFIQSREFADLATAQDRQDQGLPEQWVEKVARMADGAKVVVVIDSLDVLSIAREHCVLTYFLAQIDRLLLIPNVTVVTACRDFDRHYDRRIAERKWDCELKCPPLGWDAEIEPLLNKLNINVTSIDAVTRELIKNPRELALFVELAQKEGSFNVVNSQALARRYLDTIVRANSALGDAAMQVIENIANDMLKSRSLAVPHQRVTASDAMQRQLKSLNVLQETQDGKVTFGHQTLLDVLVISSAIREGITLNAFIQKLPPVPFVRPSIRSFIAQLAMEVRSEFRKQLRTVLTGNVAFHIRRLVAETFAEQLPQDEDWPLLRDLRKDHHEIFQVIYMQAVSVEWHYFWLKHLLPILKDTQDHEGLTAHVHRVSPWKNEDAAGVIAFWMDALSLSWINSEDIAIRLSFNLSEFKAENLLQVAPLLEQLLRLPRQEHSSLGIVIARCVEAGSMADNSLWHYVAGHITEDDVMAYNFGDKLNCQSHEFGNRKDCFISQRMKQAIPLLDLALKTIEQWSQLRVTNKGSWMAGSYGFLGKTSYRNAHNQRDFNHVKSESILLDAMEAAILQHAKTHSDWWQHNRDRLGFNQESALRYFAILACTAEPQANIELIGRMLCDRKLLESDLQYELGSLLQVAFIHLEASIQDAVMATIQTIYEEHLTEEHESLWVLKNRADLIVTIPCHLRSAEAQTMLDAYEKTHGDLVRQPSIGMRGGVVSAPFSFEVFLNASDECVLRLLAHYYGYGRGFDDFLVGGEHEVGGQLREASSRDPTRFLSLLSSNWIDISKGFRDDIMDGVANYLAHRYGHLQPSGVWQPIEEPNAQILVSSILEELEKHPLHWHLNRSASDAIQACSHVIQDEENATRLAFQAIGFAHHQEESYIKGDSVDLLTTGINMMRGHIAEALMILTTKLQEHNVPFPELLSPTLRRFASNEHRAIRALILRRLPYLQSQNAELGWDLFNLAMQDASGLWQFAEPCLYYAYRDHFEMVSPLLAQIRSEGCGKDLETWGRISALAALSKRIDFTVWLEELKALNDTEAWHGAANVWTHPENIRLHREQCLAGIEAGLNADAHHAIAVAQQIDHIFRDITPVISLPSELLQLCFNVFMMDDKNKHHRLYGFDEWLNATSQIDSESALAATEIYLDYVSRAKPYLHDPENNLTQLITRLFTQAEEKEESDNGAMLQRVVFLQDKLLSLGLSSINEWLKAAERL